MHERHFVLVLPFLVGAVFGEYLPDWGVRDANFMRTGWKEQLSIGSICLF